MNAHVEIFWTLSPDDDAYKALAAIGVRRLAALVNVSPQTVCNWLNGGRIPDASFARACEAANLRQPMLTVRDLRRNGGAVMREYKFTGGIVKKSAGRPRKSKPEPANV